MPDFDFRLAAFVQPLDNGLLLGEALFFPEISLLGRRLAVVHQTLQTNARILTESLPPEDLFRRHIAGTPETSEVVIELSPPRSIAWRRPVTLTFPIIRWTHGIAAHVAYVPALGIEVLAASASELDAILPDHIRAALARSRATASLGNLIWVQRCRKLRLQELTFSASIPSPRQRAMQSAEHEDRNTSVLRQIGTNLRKAVLDEAFECDEIVHRLAELLVRPRSALLVGTSGTGKTAAFHEVVRRRDLLGLKRVPFWATSGSRLVAGMAGFGSWQARCQSLWREASRLGAVIHLGNLIELMEVGKSAGNAQGIAAFLRPYVGRGDLLAVAECTPQQLALVERHDPRLLDVFTQVRVEEPSLERGRSLLLSVALRHAEQQRETSIAQDALDALDLLHRRYATYSAYPGRPVRFLRNLLQDRPPGTTVVAADVTAAFAQETGLPRVLLEESERLDLDATRQWFRDRVIGQNEAVDLVVDLLGNVKAGLTRPRKPVASLLFIGPTGVGKTEMAKALAEFLFGSRQRLTRFDMSEYADAVAVGRLTGGRFSEEGALTAAVREQPFCVVLFDEVEKAHPQFFDLLLQVLGEARLTDAAGRLADFSNAVVIMTSNLGAQSYQQGTLGLVRDRAARQEAREHFTTEMQRFVRPELFGRIDAIVPFAPLDEETLIGIAERQLELLRSRDGIRYRSVTLDIAPGVAGHLARLGFDPRYGARPLKRAIEQQLLAPLAEKMNQYTADTPLGVMVGLQSAKLVVQVKARQDAGGRPVTSSDSEGIRLAAPIVDLRRDLQCLQQSAVVLELVAELVLLRNKAKRLERREAKKSELLKLLATISREQRLLDEVNELDRRVAALEDLILFNLYQDRPEEVKRLAGDRYDARRQWENILMTFYCRGFAHPDDVTVAVYSEDAEAMVDLARAYHELVSAASGRVTVRQVLPPQIVEDEPTPVVKPVKDVEAFFLELPARVVGIILDIHGPCLCPRLQPEAGVHEFQTKRLARCLVETRQGSAASYEPPEGIHRRGAIPGQPVRRTCHWGRDEVEDRRLNAKLVARREHLDDVLQNLTRALIVREADRQVER